MLAYPPGLEPETLEALATTFDNYAHQGAGQIVYEDCSAPDVDPASNVEMQQWLNMLESMEGGAYDADLGMMAMQAWQLSQYETAQTSLTTLTEMALETQNLAAAMLKTREAWHPAHSPLAWQLALETPGAGWPASLPWTQQPDMLSAQWSQKADATILSTPGTPPAAKAQRPTRYKGKSLIDIAAKNQQKRQELATEPLHGVSWAQPELTPLYVDSGTLAEELLGENKAATKTQERKSERSHRRGQSLIDIAAKARLSQQVNPQEPVNDMAATKSESSSQDAGEDASGSSSGGAKSPKEKQCCKACGGTLRNTFKFCIYCGSSATPA